MDRADTVTDFPSCALLDEITSLKETTSFNENSFYDKFDPLEIKEILASDDEKNENVQRWDSLTGPYGTALRDSLIGPEMSYICPKVEQEEEPIAELIELSSDNCESIIVSDEITTLNSAFETEPSLSLSTWEGRHNFRVEVSSTNSSKKWVHNKDLNKVFLKLFDILPLEVRVSEWIDGVIHILPVFTSSEHKAQPVPRCYLHSKPEEDKGLLWAHHVVQVDSPHAKYWTMSNGFPCVTVPLMRPHGGEDASLIYVKFGCQGTCTGGPNRRPFCLLLTLIDKFGNEVGRQTLDAKVCSCPVRDSGLSTKRLLVEKKGKRASTSLQSGKRIKNEVEKIDGHKCELVAVPKEIVPEVKRYINQLCAEKHARNTGFSFPFPNL